MVCLGWSRHLDLVPADQRESVGKRRTLIIIIIVYSRIHVRMYIYRVRIIDYYVYTGIYNIPGANELTLRICAHACIITWYTDLH